jgi:hypothetical protein
MSSIKLTAGTKTTAKVTDQLAYPKTKAINSAIEK